MKKKNIFEVIFLLEYKMLNFLYINKLFILKIKNYLETLDLFQFFINKDY